MIIAVFIQICIFNKLSIHNLHSPVTLRRRAEKTLLWQQKRRTSTYTVREKTGPRPWQEDREEKVFMLASCKGFRISESVKFLLVESGILKIFASGILNPGPWNSKYRCRNPEFHSQLESRIQVPLKKIWIPVIRIRFHGVESRIQDFLVKWGDLCTNNNRGEWLKPNRTCSPPFLLKSV